MWKVTWKGMVAHTGRLLATAIAILIGVAFVAGAFVLTDTVDAAFSRAVDAGAAKIDVQVRTMTKFSGSADFYSQREPIPQELEAQVARVDGVAKAEGYVLGYAQLVGKDGKAITPSGPPTLGLSATSVDKYVAGRAPKDIGEMAIDEVTAKRNGFAVGDQVKVLFQGPSQTFTVSGLTDAANNLGATVSTFDLKTAQLALNRRNVFDEINVNARQGVSASELASRITRVVPKDVEVITSAAAADQASQSWKPFLSVLNTLLLVFAGVALLVGVIIISNTFSILVAQRTRELGLLRALGASRAQIRSSVLGEAVVVALVSSAVGLAVGVGVAIGLLAFMKALGIDIPTTTPVFLPRTAIAGMVAGVGATAFSAVLPVRRATRISPMAALAEGIVDRVGSVKLRTGIAVVAVVLGSALLAIGAFGDVPYALVYVLVGSVLAIVGVVVLTPLFARPVALVIGAPFAKWFGEPATLGRQNAMRNPRRMAASATALMIGLALVGFFTILSESFKASARSTIDDKMRADLVLMPKSAMGGGFSPELANRLEVTPEVGKVLELRTGQVGLAGRAQSIGASDTRDIMSFIEVDKETEASIKALTDQGVLVGKDLALQQGWKVGDSVTLTFARTGEKSLPIQGLTGQIGQGQIPFLITLVNYEANFSQSLDNSVYLAKADGVTATQLRKAVDEVAGTYPSVAVRNPKELQQEIDKQINQMLAMFSALLILSIIIALVGILNTLNLSIVERTRELGLLRAVGMKRGQVAAMIEWESVITAVLGAVLGTALAIVFGIVVTAAIADQGMTQLSIPYPMIAIYVVVGAVVGVVAAVIPAWRAARQPILEAVSHE
ncbi:MAG TPA: FtsX-like permease family protein [Acidimicrobiales bacterium]|nr:FtsX-like permease family protein [Acidimicrobiales bacterium]